MIRGIVIARNDVEYWRYILQAHRRKIAQLNRPRKHVLFSDPIFDFCQIGPQVLYGSTAAVCLQSAFGFGSRQVDLGFKDFRVCYSKITWINNLEMIPLFRQPRVGSFRLFGSHRGREFAQITSIGSNQRRANLVERRRARVISEEKQWLQISLIQR